MSTGIHINGTDSKSLEIITFHIDHKDEVVATPTVKKTVGVYQSCVNRAYGCTSRTVRNWLRVSFAGGLSAIGGVMAGDPQVAIVFGASALTLTWLGSIIGGIGNGASTWLAWETDADDRITALEARVLALESRLRV